MKVQSKGGKVFMSGQSQAVRLPKKYRFKKDCNEVSIRRVGRHLILSPKFSSWDDYFLNSTRPSNDFGETVLDGKKNEGTLEKRVSFNL